jgi:hypothetical protein
MLRLRVSFARKVPARSFSRGCEFSGQYIGVVPAIELADEIQFHPLQDQRRFVARLSQLPQPIQQRFRIMKISFSHDTSMR